MNREELTKFLLKARTKTYAGSGGKVEPVFAGLEQILKNGEEVYRFFYAGGILARV